jgi:superfamily II DNA or RNA helicase
MSVIYVEKINESQLKIHTEQAIEQELWEFYSFRDPNYKFTPQYRKYKWNGYIRLFQKRSKTLPAGLFRHLCIFAKERNHTIQGYQYLAQNFSIEDARNYTKGLNITTKGISITPYDHQVLAITKALRYKRTILESSTSSGKSLICYTISRYLIEKEKRGLIIVPTIGLVEQMYSDFQDYSSFNGWNTSTYVHKIYGGLDKFSVKQIYLSTWQSIYEMEDPDWYRQFEWVVGDEAHKFTGKSLTGLMTQMTNADYRIGMTGTVQDGEVHRLVLEGNFGPIAKIATNKELMDKKIVSDLLVKCLVLRYPQTECYAVSKMDYHKELDFLVTHKYRNNFIKNLSLSLKGNTMILFQFVEKHGKVLYELIKQAAGNRSVYLICGETEVEQREYIRKIVETENDAIIIASFGTCQEGISIKKIHSIIFASPSKSKIRVLQSIGRGLRLDESKEFATLYDIADDLRIGDEINITLLHYVERQKLYHREQFKVKVYNVNLGSKS